MPITDELSAQFNLFVVDASEREEEILNFLHSHGIMETCVICSPKKHWFKIYHYIQLSGEKKLKYMYTKACGGYESDRKLVEVSFEDFKKHVLSKLNNLSKN